MLFEHWDQPGNLVVAGPVPEMLPGLNLGGVPAMNGQPALQHSGIPRHGVGDGGSQGRVGPLHVRGVGLARLRQGGDGGRCGGDRGCLGRGHRGGGGHLGGRWCREGRGGGGCWHGGLRVRLGGVWRGWCGAGGCGVRTNDKSRCPWSISPKNRGD
jgi:hypothetical protein